MRISDWSSDVCSSDLPILVKDIRQHRHRNVALQTRDERPFAPAAFGADRGGEPNCPAGEALRRLDDVADLDRRGTGHATRQPAAEPPPTGQAPGWERLSHVVTLSVGAVGVKNKKHKQK